MTVRYRVGCFCNGGDTAADDDTGGESGVDECCEPAVSDETDERADDSDDEDKFAMLVDDLDEDNASGVTRFCDGSAKESRLVSSRCFLSFLGCWWLVSVFGFRLIALIDVLNAVC